MKRSTKTLIIIATLLVAVALVAVYIHFNSADDVETSVFFNRVGVLYTDDDGLTGIENNSELKILYKGEGFVIADKYKEGETYKAVEIKKLVISSYNITAYNANDKALYKTSYSRSTKDDEILKGLASLGFVIDYSDPNSGSFFSSLIMPIGTLLVSVILVIFLMRQMSNAGKGSMDFGKTKAQVITNVKVRFSDVAGADEEKVELQEVVDFLKSPEKYTQVGARIPRGVLLVGSPGTGKTLFAKAVAGEASVPFFSLSGSDFVEMFVGVGASRVRDLFNAAKKCQPCIVFIDEIDAVGRQRGAGLGGGNDEREQTLNQLLVQMDGFEANDGIIVMAATNRADILDPALLRPGRFDRQIYVNMPDVRGREAILKVHARNKPLTSDVSFKILARMTAGFSGADLANLLNEAAILAARDNRSLINNKDLYEGINKVVMGPQKKSRVITETDKRITAYHESGHAILARLLPHCDPVQEVSIIPRGMAAGYTMTRPDSDDNHLSKARLLDDIVMTLGGRVAEELIIHDISAGASNDISVITKRARKMVTEWGMSDKIGPVCYGDGDEIFVGRDYQTRSGYSEEKAKEIDAEIETIIKNAHEKATKLLKENKHLLDNMARLLIERETIYQDEVDMIMANKPVAEILEYMQGKDALEMSNPLAQQKNAEKKSEKHGAEQPVKETEKPVEDNVASNSTAEGNVGDDDNSDKNP
ncbi:MAG: ATP-dependent zinc metalloprotease FtsH [Christensenellaceae bacterium]